MKRIAVFVLLLSLLTGCGAQTKLQATELPETMPEDFSIRFIFWVDMLAPNIYDTEKGILQKDMVDPDGQPTMQAPLTVPDETRAEIYAKIREYSLDQLDSTPMTTAELSTDDSRIGMTPLTEYDITFTADGRTYAITGDDTAGSYPNDERAVAFCAFTDYMKTVFRDSDAYQSLPEAVSAYA